ncbi:MAG: TrkH family potassium uptake protein [Dehalococcoidia bacterium]|nr:MAG: TrkH family potassium uptake protein [Dehalococcoidia bacterium]
MSIRIVLKYLGLVLAIVGALLSFPLFWSVAIARDGAHVSFIVPMVIALLGGLSLFRYIPQERRSLSRREGLALVTCTWVGCSLVGALPYVISGTLPGFVDAFFETMSGFTTTGATVMTSIGHQPPSIVLWRNFSQWIGGMGIITFFVALFPMLGIGAARLFEAEMPGPQKERLRARIMDTARALWILYVALSLVEFGLLWVVGRIPFYDAMNITFGTMPTGGFLHLADSLAAYVDSPFVTTVVTFFMLAAGVNFALYFYALRRRRLGDLLGNPEFRLYIGIFVVCAGAVTLDLMGRSGMPIGQALQHATFQVASIQTTTGFATTDFDLWPSLSRGLLLALMIVGACAGSTGGGLKVVRLLVVVKYAFRQVVAAFSPRSVMPLKIGGETVAAATVAAITGMAILYVLALVGGFLFMSALGLDAVTAFSAVAATLGNVGPGLGAVGPVQHYAFIPASGKLVLSGLMLVGRLEFVTALALVSPSFWHWR